MRLRLTLCCQLCQSEHRECDLIDIALFNAPCVSHPAQMCYFLPTLGVAGLQVRIGPSDQDFDTLRSILAELMQNLWPVGFGPSGKTWPRCPPHLAQVTSTRRMPNELSS